MSLCAFSSDWPPRERLGLIPDEGYAELALDPAAEVVSPGDRPGEVRAKVGDWLAAGTKLVWLLYPDRTEARVYRGDVPSPSCGRMNPWMRKTFFRASPVPSRPSSPSG